jgi:hypothetical protein
MECSRAFGDNFSNATDFNIYKQNSCEWVAAVSTKQGNFVCIYLDLIAEFQTINHEMFNWVDVLRLFSYISRKH